MEEEDKWIPIIITFLIMISSFFFLVYFLYIADGNKIFNYKEIIGLTGFITLGIISIISSYFWMEDSP